MTVQFRQDAEKIFSVQSEALLNFFEEAAPVGNEWRYLDREHWKNVN